MEFFYNLGGPGYVFSQSDPLLCAYILRHLKTMNFPIGSNGKSVDLEDTILKHFIYWDT